MLEHKLINFLISCRFCLAASDVSLVICEIIYKIILIFCAHCVDDFLCHTYQPFIQLFLITCDLHTITFEPCSSQKVIYVNSVQVRGNELGSFVRSSKLTAKHSSVARPRTSSPCSFTSAKREKHQTTASFFAIRLPLINLFIFLIKILQFGYIIASFMVDPLGFEPRTSRL